MKKKKVMVKKEDRQEGEAPKKEEKKQIRLIKSSADQEPLERDPSKPVTIGEKFAPKSNEISKA